MLPRATTDYLAQTNDDPLAAARAFCWDAWKGGRHPLDAEASARDMFALTDDEAKALRAGWGERP